MDFGALSTLGLGSQGVLTNDILDQLREADEAAVIQPIEDKISLVEAKQDELDEIKKLVSDLNLSVTNMTFDEPYDSVTQDIIGDSVSISTTGKVKDQTFSVEVTQLATRDIFEAKNSFSSKTASLEAGNFDISVDGSSFSIEIQDGDTLENLVDKINSQTDGKVEASILNVGGEDPYKLIIKSTGTGEKNQLSISSDSNSFSDDFERIGDPAKDAIFKFDGVEVTRSSNTVDDLVDNITITLEKTGTSTINIKKDSSKLVEGIKDFVEKFNAVVERIKEDTKYDPETAEAGLFQGSSDIKNITRSLQDIIFTTISKDGKRATDFGLEIQRDGTLSFDETKFNEAYEENSEEVEEFFKASNATDGLFNRLESKLFDISISSDGTLKVLDNSLEEQLQSYNDQLEAAQKRLDAQYDLLAQKFASYDIIMGQLSSQAAALDSMIEAALAQKD